MHVGRKSLTVRFAVIGGILAIFAFGCNDSADRDAETIGITVPPVVASTIDNEISTVDTTAVKSGENLDDDIESSYQTTTSTTIPPVNSSTPEHNSPTSTTERQSGENLDADIESSYQTTTSTTIPPVNSSTPEQNSPTFPPSTTERQSRESKDNEESDNYGNESEIAVDSIEDFAEQPNTDNSSSYIENSDSESAEASTECAEIFNYKENNMDDTETEDSQKIPYLYLSANIYFKSIGGEGVIGEADFNRIKRVIFDPVPQVEFGSFEPYRPSSRHFFELRDELGNSIIRFPIQDAWGSDDTDSRMPVSLPLHLSSWPYFVWGRIYCPPAFASYAFIHDDTEIASLKLSKNPPTISIIEPSAGQFIEGSKIQVSWIGTDLDNDPLKYFVGYTYHLNEIGRRYISWNDVTYRTNYTIIRSCPSVPEADQRYSEAKIKITVSDGTRSSYTESEIFYVSNAPVAWINYLEEGEPYAPHFNWRLSALFCGFFDPDRSPSSLLPYLRTKDLNFEWYSNLDGFLGTGNPITVFNLLSGEQTITVIVSDSFGNSASDSVKITIEDW